MSRYRMEDEYDKEPGKVKKTRFRLVEEPEDPGAAKAMLIGAGRTFDRLGAGARQMYYNVTGDDKALADLAEEQAEAKRLMAPLEAQRPISTALGGALPSMAVPMGAGVGALSMMGRSALAAAVPEALSYGSVNERAANAGMAAGMGAAGGALVAGVLGAVKKVGRGLLTANPANVAAAQVLKAEGIPLSPAQATGNRLLANVSAALDNLPLTSGAQQALAKEQQAAFNRAVAQRVGMNADALPDAVRVQARDQIGRGYEAVTARNRIGPKSLFEALDTAKAAAVDSASPRVQSLFEKVVNHVDDAGLSGAKYKQLDSELGKAARAGGVDATYIGAMRDALRNAFRKDALPADAAVLAKLDGQYQSLAQLSKATNAAGDVSPAALYPGARAKGVARQAQGELAELAAAARVALPDMVPNSGTAQRVLLQNAMLNPMTLAGGVGLASGAFAGEGAGDAGLGLLAGLAVPLATRRAVNSQALIDALSKARFKVPRGVDEGAGLLGRWGSVATTQSLLE
jgi:hypothetical protein